MQHTKKIIQKHLNVYKSVAKQLIKSWLKMKQLSLLERY